MFCLYNVLFEVKKNPGIFDFEEKLKKKLLIGRGVFIYGQFYSSWLVFTRVFFRYKIVLCTTSTLLQDLKMAFPMPWYKFLWSYLFLRCCYPETGLYMLPPQLFYFLLNCVKTEASWILGYSVILYIWPFKVLRIHFWIDFNQLDPVDRSHFGWL